MKELSGNQKAALAHILGLEDLYPREYENKYPSSNYFEVGPIHKMRMYLNDLVGFGLAVKISHMGKFGYSIFNATHKGVSLAMDELKLPGQDRWRSESTPPRIPGVYHVSMNFCGKEISEISGKPVLAYWDGVDTWSTPWATTVEEAYANSDKKQVGAMLKWSGPDLPLEKCLGSDTNQHEYKERQSA